MRKMQGNRRPQVFKLLAEALVRRVKRLMLIRMVKFCRSTILVEIWTCSGFPAIIVRSTPVTRGGA
jgi:hypothetical protein